MSRIYESKYTGKRFGMLEVIRTVRDRTTARHSTRLEVRCDCGRVYVERPDTLAEGRTDCGCVTPRHRASIEQRLWFNIAIAPDGCWNWTAAIDGHGYGQITIDRKGFRAHRIAYECFRGPIPEGLEIDHLCRNRKCCNPDHLEPVTRRVNLLRGIGFVAINAAKTHCHKGHPLSGDNLGIQKLTGYRFCRECRRISNARRWPRKRKAVQQ